MTIRGLLTIYSRALLGIGLLFGIVACQQESDNLPQTKPAKTLQLVLDDSLQLRPEEGLVYYLGKPFSGSGISYYTKETKASQIDYVAGKKNGWYKKWYPSGVLSFESAYLNGKQHGLTKTWWKNGNLRSESNFQNGVADGLQKQWYESGTKFKFQRLTSGKEEGIQQSWRENGKIYNNYEAKNGRIFGLKRATLCFELEDELVQYAD